MTPTEIAQTSSLDIDHPPRSDLPTDGGSIIRSMRVIHLSLVLAAAGLAQPVVAQTQVPTATAIKTEKGEFHVPGTAYLDGRDLAAHPPRTVMSIRVWQSPARTHAVCSSAHGTLVDLLEVQRDVKEERFYFRVKAPNCEGWLPEGSLSTRQAAPVGTRR